MDFIHKPPTGTIYTPNDYYVNMDLGLQFALASSMMYGNEHPMRYDSEPKPFYQWDRRPQHTPLTNANPRIMNNPSTHAGPLGMTTGFILGKG
jgi:hypothetical protein